jgi:hypothetical protein
LSVEGILRSGNPSGAMIKADLKMTESKDAGERESSSEEESDDDGKGEGKKKEDNSGKPIYEQVKL